MVEQLAGFAYWEVRFDADGTVDPDDAEALLDQIGDAGVTDLCVFSHGWNNDARTARNLYQGLFGQFRAVLDDRASGQARNRVLGTVGVFWPSMRWPDEDLGAPGGAASFDQGGLGGGLSDVGGVASVGDAAATSVDPTAAPPADQLKSIFTSADEQAAIDELLELLERRPADDASLRRFQALLAPIAGSDDPLAPPADEGEGALLSDPAEEVFDRFAAELAEQGVAGGGGGFSDGGAAGLGDAFGRLWDGAKEALRQATYWRMKKRAGVVGEHGLGPLIGRLAAADSALRVHLVGHSFGARLVSYSLAGLPAAALSPASVVKSLTLLQGAFSHFAFAASLPFDPQRSGALAGMQTRVDGPLVVSHTRADTAVGRFYPLASIAAGQDAAALDDRFYRWGGMGHDGAQSVAAAAATLGQVGVAYPFAPGKFLNLDANQVIRNGRPPSGAHSDIIHPQVAWALLSAAGLLT